ncbi:MAG: SH3 domain-containing protein [Rhizonema sp. PD37]|nr:SH3 domain-containing protein [Rhizonema sp. PD37]
MKTTIQARLFSSVSITLISTISFFFKAPLVNAQSVSAVVFDPPSNVRVKPNGEVLCTVTSAKTIDVYGYRNEWYKTNICGSSGYIHESQVRLQQGSAATGSCSVTGIQTGQLALRFTPDGKSRAGLDNGNVVQPIKSQGIWSYVRVLGGPNNNINGLEGWVNANYLSCS